MVNVSDRYIYFEWFDKNGQIQDKITDVAVLKKLGASLLLFEIKLFPSVDVDT
jgi:hypothetical protein